MSDRRTASVYVAVIGPGTASPEEIGVARRVGRELARGGHLVLTGGLGGVMAAACQGAHDAGGVTIGMLPGADRHSGNPYLTVALATGLGELRNGLLVRASDAVICVGGSWGTLSEVALAVRTGVPVVAVGGWPMPAAGVLNADSAEAAVQVALDAIQRSRPGGVTAG